MLVRGNRCTGADVHWADEDDDDTLHPMGGAQESGAAVEIAAGPAGLERLKSRKTSRVVRQSPAPSH